jgi:hypothetical protein
MNTIKILILAVLITFSSQVSANTDNPENDLKLVSKQIETLLKHSEIPIYGDKVVTIKFKVNRNNKIIAVSNDSNSYDISKFIKKRLNLKNLSIDKTSKYRFYSIPIKFLSTID